jgi:hypothetical protein
MKRTLALAVAFTAALGLTGIAEAASATTPKMVTIGSPLGFNDYQVRTTVTLDTATRVVVTSEAYRHPREVEFDQVLPAGTHAVEIDCRSTRLPHSWVVTFTVGTTTTRVGSASLKCE